MKTNSPPYLFIEFHHFFFKVFRKKTKLVAKGYSKQEGIDYTKTYASIACLKAMHILVSFATHTKLKLYQMDIKSAFLNGLIQEELIIFIFKLFFGIFLL